MWVNRYLSSSNVYAQLAQKYGELDKANFGKKEIGETQTADSVSIGINEKYDENDYQRVLDKFKSSDADVKAHEQLHASLAGTKSPISYKYQAGPDGKLYAVGGEVRFDTSMPKDPKEAALKLDKIQKAASAPEGLSAADASIATSANLMKQMIQMKIEGVGNENR
jgi:hypothetical protein